MHQPLLRPTRLEEWFSRGRGGTGICTNCSKREHAGLIFVFGGYQVYAINNKTDRTVH